MCVHFYIYISYINLFNDQASHLRLQEYGEVPVKGDGTQVHAQTQETMLVPGLFIICYFNHYVILFHPRPNLVIVLQLCCLFFKTLLSSSDVLERTFKSCIMLNFYGVEDFFCLRKKIRLIFTVLEKYSLTVVLLSRRNFRPFIENCDAI